jgi:cytochrome c biogenesis protein CcmG, thiol:disulfide interchange protein DsbE
MKNTLAILGLCLLLLAAVNPARAQVTPKAGVADDTNYQIAPDFTLTDINGDEVTLYDLLVDGPVYLESWDLPCVNCIAELDALMPIYDSLQAQGLQIIALSVDKPADEAKVKAFARTKKWPYITLLDQQHEVKDAYGIVIKPTAYLINMDGEIVFTHIGFKKGDEKRIEEEFLKWLPPVEDDSSGDGE